MIKRCGGNVSRKDAKTQRRKGKLDSMDGMRRSGSFGGINRTNATYGERWEWGGKIGGRQMLNIYCGW